MGFNQKKSKTNTELIAGNTGLLTLRRFHFGMLSCCRKRKSLPFTQQATGNLLQTDFLQGSSSCQLVSEVSWVLSTFQWIVFCIYCGKECSQTKCWSYAEFLKNSQNLSFKFIVLFKKKNMKHVSQFSHRID